MSYSAASVGEGAAGSAGAAGGGHRMEGGGARRPRRPRVVLEVHFPEVEVEDGAELMRQASTERVRGVLGCGTRELRYVGVRLLAGVAA